MRTGSGNARPVSRRNSGQSRSLTIAQSAICQRLPRPPQTWHLLVARERSTALALTRATRPAAASRTAPSVLIAKRSATPRSPRRRAATRYEPSLVSLAVDFLNAALGTPTVERLEAVVMTSSSRLGTAPRPIEYLVGGINLADYQDRGRR